MNIDENNHLNMVIYLINSNLYCQLRIIWSTQIYVVNYMYVVIYLIKSQLYC